MAERKKVDLMDEEDYAAFIDKHMRAHFGQDYKCPPIFAYNAICSDILHQNLNIVKKCVEIVFHYPLQIEKRKYTKKIALLMTGIRDKVNARMKEDFTDKQFGGDGVFSLLGEQVKVFVRGGAHRSFGPRPPRVDGAVLHLAEK